MKAAMSKATPDAAPCFQVVARSAQTDRFVHTRMPPPAQWPTLRYELPELRALQHAAQCNLVHELLDKAPDSGWGDNTLLRSPNRSLSYRQVRVEVDRRVGVLIQDLRLEPGTRVLLRGGNSIEMALAWLAVVKAGMVAVATMPLLRAKELGEIIAKAQPVLALCDAALLAELQQAQSLHPVLASIVNMPSVVLPVAGSVGSYTPLHGVSGVVGVKSGLTSQAGGCDVMAYVSMHGGFPVMILTAVMGQVFSIDRLSTAGSEALRLAHETEVGLVPITALGDREKVGELTFASGSTGVVAARSVVVPSWPGNNVGVSLQMTRTVRGEVPAGSVIGRARVDSGAFHLSVPLVTARRIPGLSLWQRLV